MNEEDLASLSTLELVQILLNSKDDEEQFDMLIEYFLSSHSPEQSWDQFHDNEESLADPELFELVMTKVKDAYLPEIFLEAINILASLGKIYSSSNFKQLNSF